ncbi:MAG: 2-C-methyl-D-erythritol 4-phosphate cytidylyltransferase [Peptococcaceae bacterium]|nr:2-C-methyl-D-erythritol 4-phosphate cytidylyltransferase [Peptococcaceae bacterium]
MAKIAAIIPAAGQGRRMGDQGNKLLLELAGIPILVYTLSIFEACPLVSEIVIPTAPQDIPAIQKIVKAHGFKKVNSIVEGGSERQESVARALTALSPFIAKVVVHDGARPLLTLAELEAFLREAEACQAAIMAVPLKDTVKRVDERGWVVETPPRENLRAVQTPQFFDRPLLEKVHKLAEAEGYSATDDAALMEWQGYPVKIIPGSYENLKITTPEDLLLAEIILQKRKERDS